MGQYATIRTISKKLNNIKYKLLNNLKINAFDVIDLIWMPKYRSNHQIENIIMELIEIYRNIVVNEDLNESLRKCLVLWSGKFLSNEENIKKAIRGLKMSKEEANYVEKDIVTARIDGMICRAEEAGLEKGLEKGREEGLEEGIKSTKIETARNIFKKGFSVEDIVEITGLSEKSILNSL